MTVGDSIHYLLLDNPVSRGLGSAVSSIARSTGIISPSKTQISAKSASTQIMSNGLPLWKLAGTNLHFVRLAGLSGAAAVILGAYGSHRKYPEDKGELRGVFEVANRFHFFHSIALMAIPLVRRPVLTGSLMIVGTLLFSGTCYYRAFTGDRTLSGIAPIGGCCLILAWASLML